MPTHPSLQDVVKEAMADGCWGLLRDGPGYDRWNNELAEFFGRLAVHTAKEAPRYERIALEAEGNGLSRKYCFHCLAYSAAAALLEADPANLNNFTPKDLHSRSEMYSHLARCARSLADYYGRRAKLFGRQDQKGEIFAKWCDEEANHFDKQAKEDLRQASMSLTGRQSRGTKFAKEHLLFMRSLSTDMRRHFGKPYHDVVAAISGVAYRRLVITAEEVRAACRGLPPVEREQHLLDEESKEALEVFARLRLAPTDKSTTGKLDTK